MSGDAADAYLRARRLAGAEASTSSEASYLRPEITHAVDSEVAAWLQARAHVFCWRFKSESLLQNLRPVPTHPQRLASDAKTLRADSNDVVDRLKQLESRAPQRLSYPPAPLPASLQFRDVIQDGAEPAHASTSASHLCCDCSAKAFLQLTMGFRDSVP